MRVSLTQNELYEAIGEYLRNKMGLNNNTSFDITFTAGRGSKGYTADVEINSVKTPSPVIPRTFVQSADPGVGVAPVSAPVAITMDPEEPGAVDPSASSDAEIGDGSEGNPAAVGVNSASTLFD